jgi:hypothetical protein
VASNIEKYLKELQEALMAGGADPALVQDALFDAEEYLRAEMAVGGTAERGTATYEKRFARAVEGYGAPDEVAAAYLGAPRLGDIGEAAAAAGEAAGTATGTAVDATPEAPAPAPPAPASPTPTAASPAPTSSAPPAPVGVAAGAAAATGAARPSVWRQVLGVVVDPSVYKALLYMLLSLATGIFYFTVVVTGVSTAGGMLFLIIGVPLFLLVLGIVRAMSLFESRLVEGLLGTRMPRRERADPPAASILERIGFWIRDGRTWASMAYMILMLPLGIVYFTIAVTGLAVGFGLIGTPFGDWARDQTFFWHGAEYTWSIPTWAMPIAVVAGLLVLLLMLHLIRWIGRGHAAFAKRMLVRLAR